MENKKHGGGSMIEIIYKGEDEEKKEEVYVKLPKNVRQIGESRGEEYKIYMEDFAMTYVKHFGGRKLKYGVLLGNIKRGNGNSYIFITGAVCANPILDNEIVFDEDVWTGIYEDIKMYFEDVEIVGWFVSMPGVLENDKAQIQKVHLDNFAGSDRVCFLVDYMEGEDTFFRYGDGKMVEIGGHFIYYEKNADMQAYMLVKREEDVILPQEYEQFTKKGITSKVHKIFFADGNNPGLVENNNTKNKEDTKDRRGRHLPAFAYSVSSFMILAMLLGTIALMNTSGQLKELKKVVAVMDKKENDTTKPEVRVIDVAGNTFPTTIQEESESTEESSEESSVETDESQDTNVETESTEELTTQAAEENETESNDLAEESKEESTEAETVASVADSSSNVVAKPHYYVVEPGDSLYSISKKNYGNISMIESIRDANNITNENYIKEGETIILP